MFFLKRRMAIHHEVMLVNHHQCTSMYQNALAARTVTDIDWQHVTTKATACQEKRKEWIRIMILAFFPVLFHSSNPVDPVQNPGALPGLLAWIIDRPPGPTGTSVTCADASHLGNRDRKDLVGGKGLLLNASESADAVPCGSTQATVVTHTHTHACMHACMHACFIHLHTLTRLRQPVVVTSW